MVSASLRSALQFRKLHFADRRMRLVGRERSDRLSTRTRQPQQVAQKGQMRGANDRVTKQMAPFSATCAAGIIGGRAADTCVAGATSLGRTRSACFAAGARRSRGAAPEIARRDARDRDVARPVPGRDDERDRRVDRSAQATRGVGDRHAAASSVPSIAENAVARADAGGRRLDRRAPRGRRRARVVPARVRDADRATCR